MAITNEVNPIRSEAEAIALACCFVQEEQAYFDGKGTHQRGRERFYRNRLATEAGYSYQEAYEEFHKWVKERRAT